MTDDELLRLFDAMRQESAASHEETRRHFDVTAGSVKRENTAAHGETRRHFDVTVEGVKPEVRLVAESVTVTNDSLTRETTDIRAEMRSGFAETQAMIKFSHLELDRRVRALEDGQRTVEQTLAEVQAGLDRLEGSTH